MDHVYRYVAAGCLRSKVVLTQDKGLAVVGFCLCTLPKIHYQVLLISTAAVGASAFVLGIDCFTTANLKEVRCSLFIDLK